jgi:uncharacterized membrane protein YhiD involved in acid resistance
MADNPPKKVSFTGINNGVSMLDLLAVQSSTANATIITLAYTLLLAFVLSSIIGWTYERTFLGLSYSRNYVQALVLSSVVAATVMQAIGDNVGRGLGMLGALSIVRFRTSFKDPRDIMFIFAALGAGIGCGVYAWGAAVGGTLAFCVVAFLLSRTGLGTKHFFDGMLRFAMPNTSEPRLETEKILRKNLKTFILITMREVNGGERIDVAYQIKLKASKPAAEVLAELSKVEGLSDIQFMMQDATTDM